MSLNGKRVLVTGGASGIGRGIVELFAEQGATLVVADVSEAAGQAVVAGLGGDAHRFVRLDVADEAAWQQALPTIAPDGTLDIAILNAGVMLRRPGEPGLNDPVPWLTRPNLERLIGVNLYGVIWGVLACLPAIERSGGTIMVMSSAGGLQPVPFDPAYAMTKHGLVGFARSIAPGIAERGVRLVTVCPHSVDTAMQPPDLVEINQAHGYSSPPSHMAASTLHIYDHAKSGEVWQSQAIGLPYEVPAPPAVKIKH